MGWCLIPLLHFKEEAALSKEGVMRHAGGQLGSHIGSYSLPESSAWAAYLSSPASTAMSPVPSTDKPSQWQAPSQQVSSPFPQCRYTCTTLYDMIQVRQGLYSAPTIHDVCVSHKVRSIASARYLAEQRGLLHRQAR